MIHDFIRVLFAADEHQAQTAVEGSCHFVNIHITLINKQQNHQDVVR
jgi:hypothetical protein